MLHGGPGTPGGMLQPAVVLSAKTGILEPFLYGASIAKQIAELYEIIIKHGHKQVKLVGHSWGGWLAYLFAANHNY